MKREAAPALNDHCTVLCYDTPCPAALLTDVCSVFLKLSAYSSLDHKEKQGSDIQQGDYQNSWTGSALPQSTPTQEMDHHVAAPEANDKPFVSGDHKYRCGQMSHSNTSDFIKKTWKHVDFQYRRTKLGHWWTVQQFPFEDVKMAWAVWWDMRWTESKHLLPAVPHFCFKACFVTTLVISQNIYWTRGSGNGRLMTECQYPRTISAYLFLDS